jgi:hypothetical protein
VTVAANPLVPRRRKSVTMATEVDFVMMDLQRMEEV